MARRDRPRADAIVTRTEGLAIGITAADCGPILLVDPAARVIGAAHAGWKGALTGMLESTVDAMEKLGADRSGIVAAIGPLIRQHSYEVGGEFVERFLDADAEQWRASSFPATRAGHAMFDLAGFIRMRLENAGVLMIDDIGVDTYSDERFYSYRRSVHRKEPDYGRHVHASRWSANSPAIPAAVSPGLLRRGLAAAHRGQQDDPRQHIHRHHQIHAVGGAAGPLL